MLHTKGIYCTNDIMSQSYTYVRTHTVTVHGEYMQLHSFISHGIYYNGLHVCLHSCVGDMNTYCLIPL